MKSMARCAVYAFLGVVMASSSGCLTDIVKRLYKEIMSEPGEIDAELAATYFDGPKVQPGIALSISVSATGAKGHASSQYIVDPEGYIAMELIGAVKVDGYTLIELQQKLAELYKEYYLEPHVTATFVSSGAVSPWGTITIMGEVGKQGPVDVPSTQELRLTRALQMAGGVTNLADRRKIKISRCDREGKITVTYVDLIEIGEDGRSDKDMLLKAGDVVWVPMSWY